MHKNNEIPYMKILYLIIFFFCCISSYAQEQAAIVPASFINLQNVSLSAPMGENPAANTFDEDCQRYRAMKITGIVLLGTGGGLVIAGATSFTIGIAEALGEPLGPPAGAQQRTSIAPLLAGLVCMGVGSIFIIAGIPVTIIGSIKYKRNCRNSYGSSSMQITTNGNGLALNF
jgi:hypothetical protein